MNWPQTYYLFGHGIGVSAALAALPILAVLLILGVFLAGPRSAIKHPDRVPELTDVNRRLGARTGWNAVGVNDLPKQTLALAATKGSTMIGQAAKDGCM